jgi:hypothetical protein
MSSTRGGGHMWGIWSSIASPLWGFWLAFWARVRAIWTKITFINIVFIAIYCKMVGCLTNIYYLTVGHLIENLLKKSNAPHMPASLSGAEHWKNQHLSNFIWISCVTSLQSTVKKGQVGLHCYKGHSIQWYQTNISMALFSKASSSAINQIVFLTSMKYRNSLGNKWEKILRDKFST